MGVKYYTHFVLTGDAVEGSDQEFSGIVETAIASPSGRKKGPPPT